MMVMMLFWLMEEMTRWEDWVDTYTHEGITVRVSLSLETARFLTSSNSQTSHLASKACVHRAAQPD